MYGCIRLEVRVEAGRWLEGFGVRKDAFLAVRRYDWDGGRRRGYRASDRLR
jgi:hypothetical protein